MATLHSQLPPLILGGGAYNTQMNADPESLPLIPLFQRAFSLGINAIDTSPYYGPSEELIGRALKDSAITSSYPRSSYLLLTKAGRKAEDHFDYSPQWIRESVLRSIQRLCPANNEDAYLDVVFLHDIEFVSEEDVIAAMEQLQWLKSSGKIRYVGISGYPLAIIEKRARRIREELGSPVDVVQCYCHCSLQNDALVSGGWLQKFRDAGVNCVLSSSPLAMGLLTGRPAPSFHPAPEDLRQKCLQAAERCRELGTTLPQVAMQWALGTWHSPEVVKLGGGKTITGVSSVEELEVNLAAYRAVMKGEQQDAIRDLGAVDEELWKKNQDLFKEIRSILGDWAGYDWDSPPKVWWEVREVKAKL